ncbi:MAG: hypothetical protein C0480_29115 [Bradyrhizobium sp.]|nr:hypothetical protein [Bradyrhizobium sp.]
MQSIEPGISRFRVWSFGPSRNDDGTIDRNVSSTRGVDGRDKPGHDKRRWSLSGQASWRTSLSESAA